MHCRTKGFSISQKNSRSDNPEGDRRAEPVCSDLKHGAVIFLVVALLAMVALSPRAVIAQTHPAARELSRAIEDNSFFVEEAYNQEEGVVQHISSASYFRRPQENFFFTFTQEWPVFSATHQFSYTLPYSWLNANHVHGIGDLMLNYRYQLLTGDQWASLAPRFSLLLPTGNSDEGLGWGVVGVQCNLPASKRISEPFVVHANLGFTVLPNVKGITLQGIQVRRTLWSYTGAGSLIWLAYPSLNVMLECAGSITSEIDDRGTVEHATEFILSPAVRFALDVHELQIVPGIGIPVRFVRDERTAGIFLYLSFEHPF